ncbi:MAG: hypothetical protein KKA42_00790 [candidate division Zixibacteria bacterium]|nr:hypothetical protein [candidate division Zixibacteria bacterium]
MTDETQIMPSDDQNQNAATAADASPAAAKKRNLPKYLMFGGGGLVAVVLIVVVTLLVAGGGDQPAAQSDATATSEASPAHAEAAEPHHEAASNETDHRAEAAAEAQYDEPEDGVPDFEALAGDALSGEDSLLAALENDPSVLNSIMNTLDYLDYVPEDEELGAEADAAMSVEDSVAKVKWFEERETALATREATVEKRTRELDKLEKKVNQKILRLEQAESTRVTQLARLYDGMEARAVARLAANLDDNTMVSILPRMKPKNASAVLSLMPAKRAAKLSKQLITIAEN